MKKKAIAPKGILPQEEIKKGIESGWASVAYPLEDLMKDPKKVPAIQAVIDDLKSSTGISISMLELPMLQILNPNKAFTVNGRPAIFLEKGPERVRNKQKYLTGVKVLYLDTFDIIDEGELDPATVAHTEIVRNMQRNSAYLVNHFINYNHNRLVEFVCSGRNTPIQNIRLMLQRAHKQLKERLAELKLQQERALRPVEVPEHLLDTRKNLMTDIGVSEENRSLVVDPGAARAMADSIEKQFMFLVSNYWDRPRIILNTDSEELVKLFKNTPGISDDAKIDIVEALKKIMRIVDEEWDTERKEREEYEKARGAKPEETKTDKAPKEVTFQNWALRKIKPIAEETAHNIIKATSISPRKYRGIDAYSRQGEAVSRSIQNTEIDIIERTIGYVDSTVKTIKTIGDDLKSKGQKVVVSSMSPDQVRSLCDAAQMLGEFSRTYASPVVNENNKIDKRKMGVGSKPLANILVSSYLALCQQALRGIACEGRSENDYVANGISSLCEDLSNEAEIS
jgi:hypothetical protein